MREKTFLERERWKGRVPTFRGWHVGPPPIASAHVLVPPPPSPSSSLSTTSRERMWAREREKRVGEMALLPFTCETNGWRGEGKCIGKFECSTDWDREKLQALAEFDAGGGGDVVSGDGRSWWAVWSSPRLPLKRLRSSSPSLRRLHCLRFRSENFSVIAFPRVDRFKFPGGSFFSFSFSGWRFVTSYIWKLVASFFFLFVFLKFKLYLLCIGIIKVKQIVLNVHLSLNDLHLHGL